jgi:hypothetical protein
METNTCFLITLLGRSVAGEGVFFAGSFGLAAAVAVGEGVFFLVGSLGLFLFPGCAAAAAGEGVLLLAGSLGPSFLAVLLLLEKKSCYYSFFMAVLLLLLEKVS